MTWGEDYVDTPSTLFVKEFLEDQPVSWRERDLFWTLNKWCAIAAAVIAVIVVVAA